MGQGLGAVTARRAPFGARLRHDDVLTECASADVLCVQELFSRDAQLFFDGVGQGTFTARFRDDNRVRFTTMLAGAPTPEKNALAHAFDPTGAAQRIDYVLWRGAASGGVRPAGLTRFFDQPLARSAPGGGTSAWASDHYGLTATFEIA